MTDITVKFLDEQRGILTTLLVDTPLVEPGVERLWRALFLLRVQVVCADVQTIGRRIHLRLSVCDFDGSLLDRQRQREILGALCEELAAPPSTPARLERPGPGIRSATRLP
jgi:hypothetical protein